VILRISRLTCVMLSTRRCRLRDRSANIPDHVGWFVSGTCWRQRYPDDLDADHLGNRLTRCIHARGTFPCACGSCAPSFPPIRLIAACLFAGGKVSRAGLARTLNRHFDLCLLPCVRSFL
jgi:hypothetical protein